MKIFLIISLVLLFIFFLHDFQLLNQKAWNILLGLSGVGGIFSFQFMKKRGFLETLNSRREKIQNYRSHFIRSLNKKGMSQDTYQAKLSELDALEKDAYLSILKSSGLYTHEMSNTVQEIKAQDLHDLVYKIVASSNQLK